MKLTRIILASSPGVSDPPKSAPLKYIPYMMPLGWNLNQRYWVDWAAWKPDPFRPVYREKNFLNTWPSRFSHHRKSRFIPLVNIRYSPQALEEAIKLIPDGARFFSHDLYKDVRRPPQRIKAYSDGIVHDWWLNYWTLHSIRYQLKLSHNHLHEETKKILEERPPSNDARRMVSNYDEYRMYTDYEETKLARDHRSRWINVHRSLQGMSTKIKQSNEENRYYAHKKKQDEFWSSRKILINRVKAMRHSGSDVSSRDLPIPTFRIRAFEHE